MTVEIDVEDAGWLAIAGLEALVRDAVAATFAAVDRNDADYDVSIVFAGDDTVAALNAEWRSKARPTNVLSFPAEPMPVPAGEPRPLGDMILAAGVVAAEAADQHKSLPAHTTHLIIHGLLHLMGYDHETDEDAMAMESLEKRILKGLGISDPYE
ncbi:MAG: rRNA maturation RNase YbeY [Alphaproteobacteria bacterium]|nr:rRNA maturation RNase YbeY [Alphaproteobacteria bacterium]